MIPLIYLFLFLMLRFATQDEINCEANKMNAVYHSTKCCSLTFPENDPEYTNCHANYSEMAYRPPEKLKSSERIAINICSHECSLLKKGILSLKYNHEIDSDAIDLYFQAKYNKNPIFSTYMIDTFQKCIIFDSLGEVSIKFPVNDFIDKTCDPFAARIMMCVRTKAMQSCPSSAWESMTPECGIAKLYFKSCVGSIEKVVRTIN